MKCFNHPAADAVATCKSCCRGLCRECIAEVGASCCCRDRCEADVAALNELFDRGRSVYQKTGTVYKSGGVFILLFGIVFALSGVFSLTSERFTALGYFLLIMGLIFSAWSMAYFSAAKKFVKK